MKHVVKYEGEHMSFFYGISTSMSLSLFYMYITFSLAVHAHGRSLEGLLWRYSYVMLKWRKRVVVLDKKLLKCYKANSNNTPGAIIDSCPVKVW